MAEQSIVVRVPAAVAGRIRRMVAWEVGATVGSILSQAIALRRALGTAVEGAQPGRGATKGGGRTVLIKGYLSDTDTGILRELAAVSGSSIGQIVAEGVNLLCSASGGGPQRGLRRLRPGRRAGGLDDMPIVILDADEAAA